METSDLTIIGAGAAGLAAAIFAAETAPDRRIVLLEGAPSIGAKILISGGGRCNVTHKEVHPSDFNGSRNIVRNVLASFDVAATRQWFTALGVDLKEEETGKLFPVTDHARTVLDALLRRCAELKIDVRTGQRVRAVERDGEAGFVTYPDGGVLRAGRIILATGGRSLPRTGSDGAGWEIASALGHAVTPTYPALVPLVLSVDMFHAELSGVSQAVELSTLADGKSIDRRSGSMLWTHFGISGPVVLDASRHWVMARAAGQRVEMRCSVLPGDDFEGADLWLRREAKQRPRLSIGRCLAQRLPERLALVLAERVVGGAIPLGQVTREHRRALVHALTALPLPIERDRGWDFAEVTAGGVPLAEIDFRTMESRKTPGLYLIGEMLDCDGRIGGFNFQWAWSTGYVAGRAAARSSL